MKLSRSSRKAKPISSTEAWWYENPKSIDVYISTPERTVSCRISRRQLREWLKKTDAKSF